MPCANHDRIPCRGFDDAAVRIVFQIEIDLSGSRIKRVRVAGQFFRPPHREKSRSINADHEFVDCRRTGQEIRREYDMIALAPDGLALSRPYVAAEDIGSVDNGPVSSAVRPVRNGRALAAGLSHLQRLPPHLTTPEEDLITRAARVTVYPADGLPRLGGR